MNENIQSWFKQQIEHQKSSYIRISGRRNSALPSSSDLQETTDFDFQIEASELIDLILVEFRTSDAPDKISMIVAEEGDGFADEPRLIQRCAERLSSMMDSKYKQVILSHKTANHDIATADLQTLARRARYAGRLQLEHSQTTATSSTSNKPKKSAHSPPSITIEAVWKYKRLDTSKPRSNPNGASLPPIPNVGTRRPINWSQRIQHTMVDGSRGLITLQDEIVDKQPPFIKAARKFGLYEQVQTDGNFGISRIHEWGRDETGEEGGRRKWKACRLWTGIELESPPQYTE